MSPSSETQRRPRILLADDATAVRESSAAVLRIEGYDVTPCECAADALEILGSDRFDVVLVEESMPGGEAVLRAALASSSDTRVIVTACTPTVAGGEAAVRSGAWYYLPKPFTATQLQILLGLAAQAVRPGAANRLAAEAVRPIRPAVSPRHVTPVGRAPAFRHAVEMARRVAPTNVPVLISGETGTGKEVLAQFIHRHSRRADQAMVSVNCSALPDGLFESEVFGHRKGAFTGAVRDKPGLLEVAHGSTLFLDEVLEMPRPMQAKLLRVMQDGVVRRVGSEATDAVVSVRFIAATNADPQRAVLQGWLREDFYYRLNVVHLRMPPLRERVEDIPLLANHFLTTCWHRHHPGSTSVPRLTERALRVLSRHSWRGNLRELQNVLESAMVLLCPGQDVEAEDLPLSETANLRLGSSEIGDGLLADTFPLARARFLAQFEAEYLQWIFDRTKGNIADAARLAGVDRTTLYRMMRRRGLFRTPPDSWLTPAGAVLHEAPPQPVRASACWTSRRRCSRWSPPGRPTTTDGAGRSGWRRSWPTTFAPRSRPSTRSPRDCRKARPGR